MEVGDRRRLREDAPLDRQQRQVWLARLLLQGLWERRNRLQMHAPKEARADQWHVCAVARKGAHATATGGYKRAARTASRIAIILVK